MYIQIVRTVVEEGIELYSQAHGIPRSEVLRRIRLHIDETSDEHFEYDPDIDYEDPLCRLGYLYRHAAANATIFQHALSTSIYLQEVMDDAAEDTLNVCAIGGGPGTELLAIAKHLRESPQSMPRRIHFTILDNVSHWAETWDHLKDQLELWLDTASTNLDFTPPLISGSFLTLDVLNSDSYRNYSYQFRKADIVVCNYLFSENKTSLDDAQVALCRLAKLTSPGCVFVVIDRIEGNSTFQEDVVNVFEGVFDYDITVQTFNGTLGYDEQADDMGEELLDALLHPRIKFFTTYHRNPTVFWFVVERGEELSDQ